MKIFFFKLFRLFLKSLFNIKKTLNYSFQMTTTSNGKP